MADKASDWLIKREAVLDHCENILMLAVSAAISHAKKEGFNLRIEYGKDGLEIEATHRSG